MQLDQHFELAFPREVVWAAFRDIPMLVSCLPGASLQSPPGTEPIELLFAVKLGPIAAKFVGEGSVSYNEDYTGTPSGTGADRSTNSRVKGTAAFELLTEGEATRVNLAIDYVLTGALAQVGRPGIVKEIAAKLTQQFAANLQARIAERAAFASAPASEPPPPRREVAPQQLNAGVLLWSVVWGRLKHLLRLR